MYEIRFHGRGGQGAVLAAKILAKALVEEGKFVKAIPAFGFERRGAPVEAFLRYDDKEFRELTNIYNPDCIVCLDPTLQRTVDIFAGMKSNGVWVQATKKSIDQLEVPETVSKVGLCDGFGLALEILGRPITNSIMLGAFAKTTGIVSLDSLNKSMETTAFRDALLEKNIEAAQQGYEKTKTSDTKNKEA
ncbi:MAG: 2-oxoacid:acceptor oxidoreductase family protein [Deltaproteobacteria bacterium]|nr:2-oxoacid:acceptor oxidoreductase family protein [Deltaproteobacteria bacterium]